jgi:hypothetical protein
MLNIEDTTAQINAFMASNKYTVPVLPDAMSVALTYGVSGIPTAFFIGRDGIIKYIKLGAFSSVSEIQDDLSAINS